MSPGIKPGKTTPQQFDREFSILKIHLVNRRDLEFTTFRRLHPFRIINNVTVVEIESRYGPVRFRIFWLFFKTNGAEIVVEFHHPETFRIHYLVTENRRAFSAGRNMT
ncbi:hypothetical protein D3C81_1846820 [compost metagenome]